jgi:hypothetical protein
MHAVFLLPCVIAVTIIGTLMASEKFQGGKTLVWIYSAGYVFASLAAVMAADVIAQSIWYAYVTPEPDDVLLARIESLKTRLAEVDADNDKLQHQVTSLNDENNRLTLSLRPAVTLTDWSPTTLPFWPAFARQYTLEDMICDQCYPADVPCVANLQWQRSLVVQNTSWCRE